MLRTARQLIVFFLAANMLASMIPCQAKAPETFAEAFILMDADSGRVLLAQNETQEKSIASTTKIMTAIVALEHCRLSDVVTVKKAHLKEGSSMYLAEGETLTVEELLYGLLLPSGNDAAECLADHCGSGKENFVAWMNEKASALGMTHTSFANPSGLDEAGHYSCALDMARLAAYAMKNPTFARIAGTKTVTAGTRTMGNHNKLLGSFAGCIGLKTGYTSSAGRTLVTCAERDGLRLIAVTLHDSNDWNDHAALYEYGFSTYHHQSLVQRGENYAAVAVRGGTGTSVKALCAQSFAYPLSEDESVFSRVELPGSVQAPVEAGQKLGELVLRLGSEEIGRIDLVSDSTIAAVSAKKVGFAEKLWNLLTK